MLSLWSKLQIAVFKDYNLNCRYETTHAEKYKNLTDAEWAQTSEALLAKIENQQGLFTKLYTSRHGAAQTSYVISHKIAKNSKPFSDGEFIKECLVGSAAIICPEIKEPFENVPLSRRTVTRRIEDIVGNLEHEHLKWDKLAGVKTDGCPNLTGKNDGLLKRIQDKVTEMNPEQKLVFLHCIIHQGVLCKSVIKINHVTDVVTKIVESQTVCCTFGGV